MTAGGPIAFATEELFPFGPGGIGRLVHHLVFQALAEQRRAVHLFLPSTLGVTQARVREVFGPGVTASTFAASSSDALSRSQALAAHLVEFCEQAEPFEWIELPDFRGLGFATLHRAATSGLRGEPRLHLRVHGPNSLVSWHEGQRIDAARAAEFDLERSSLLLADTVIAPMAPVRDAVATFFRFDAAWRARVRLCLPPRSTGVAAPPSSAIEGQRIVFPTKVQGIKRPELFVEGVTRLMERRPRWAGRATFAAHRNPGLEEALHRRIPAALRARFEWVSWNDEERARFLAGQVVVIPSDFETLNLAAWEAAAVGARVVASTRCPAFAPGSPWADWAGFHGFDGTAEGLADALEWALDSATPPPFHVPPDPLLQVEGPAPAPRPAPVSASEIEVLVGGPEQWCRRVASVTSPWVLLLTSPDETDAEAFRHAAAVALSRRARAELIFAAGPQLESPTQAWAARRLPTGPLVVRTALAQQMLSPSHGRRALVAMARQLGLESLALFVPTRAAGPDEERFPPLYLDAHPMAVRAQRDGQPPLRRQLLDSARARLDQAIAKPLRRLRRR